MSQRSGRRVSGVAGRGRKVLGLHFGFLSLRQAGLILACARSCGEVLFAAPKSGGGSFAARAGVAQWQSTCFVNRWLGVQVPSSARCCRVRKENYYGGLPEWPKGADCKSAGYAFDGSNPSPSTAPPKQCQKKGSSLASYGEKKGQHTRGSSSVGRASAFQAERRRFEPGLPLAGSEKRLSRAAGLPRARPFQSETRGSNSDDAHLAQR